MNKTPEKILAQNRAWKARNVWWVSEYKRRWRRANPEKDRAHELVRQAIRRGDLVRPTRCGSCGANARIQAHHGDYAWPLDIIWLCSECHASRHPDRH